MTYNQVYKRVKHLGYDAFLTTQRRSLGIGIEKRCGRRALFHQSRRMGTFVNFYSQIMGEQACFMYHLVTVPLYDTLGSDAIGTSFLSSKRIHCQSNGNDDAPGVQGQG